MNNGLYIALKQNNAELWQMTDMMDAVRNEVIESKSKCGLVIYVTPNGGVSYRNASLNVAEAVAVVDKVKYDLLKGWK